MLASRLICLLGLISFVVIAWMVSSDRRRFPLRIVVAGLLLQLVLAMFVLQTTAGRALFQTLGSLFAAVTDCVTAGSGFLFDTSGSGHPLGSGLLVTFAFGVLPTIVFFSSLMSILYHIGVIQRVVWLLAWVMRRTLGTTGAETLAAAANIFVGQTEAPLVVKPYIATMTRSELNAMMTGGFATVTGALLATYGKMGGVEIGHLLTASVISAPAALVIAKVMLPESEVPADSAEMSLEADFGSVNLVGAAVQGAADGLRLAVNVAAMLVAFLALIALADLILLQLSSLVGMSHPLTVGAILGVLCAPLALLMGIPWAEAHAAGELIGIKTVANEFIAYQRLGQLDVGPEGQVSYRTKIILTYALAGFSNFGAIGIQVGGIGALVPARRDDLARLGLRAMFGGLLACCMTGAVAGFLFSEIESSNMELEGVIDRPATTQ